MKPHADWLAWVLQLVAGFLVGAFMALYVFGRHRSPLILSGDGLVGVIIGAGFIVAGPASFYGDRLWIGLSYRVIPPDGVQQSSFSKALSLVIGVTGVVVTSLVLLGKIR